MFDALNNTIRHATTMLADFGLNDENSPLVIIFGTGLVFGLVGIVFGTFCSVSRERQRQRTKREIAAYVAEGSISPEDASRIIESNETPKKG